MSQFGEKSVVLVSGGMDSTTVLYHARTMTNVIQALSFDYGQRHKIELEYARRTCEQLMIPWSLIRLPELTQFLKGSALSDPTVEVPEGHYAEDNMKLTIVPNRNMVMLSQAVAVAIGLGADMVYAAMHAGDHPVYPDCRPEFISAFNAAVRVATETHVWVNTPFIMSSKADIANAGFELGVPFEQTWSCYKGGTVHCGKCGTCVERQEAFSIAGVPDHTLYEDPDFWKEAVSAHN